MAVGDDGHLIQRDTGSGQRLGKRHARRLVVRVDVGMGTHTGVEQQQAVAMAHDIAQTRLHPRLPRCGLRPRAG